MTQNPHRSQPEVHRIASKIDAGPIGAKNSPSKRKNADFGVF